MTDFSGLLIQSPDPTKRIEGSGMYTHPQSHEFIDAVWTPNTIETPFESFRQISAPSTLTFVRRRISDTFSRNFFIFVGKDSHGEQFFSPARDHPPKVNQLEGYISVVLVLCLPPQCVTPILMFTSKAFYLRRAIVLNSPFL